MQLNYESEKPIFHQIAEFIEDGILSGAFPEETQIPSTTEISVNYKINPATALKGINLLVDSGIVYKRRGLGMFVSAGAVEALNEKRRRDFYDNYILKVIEEAKKLRIRKDEIISMIERGFLQ